MNEILPLLCFYTGSMTGGNGELELTVQLNALIGLPKFVTMMPVLNEYYH